MRWTLALAAICAALLAGSHARAEILSISAMGFNTFCPPCNGGQTNVAEEDRGVIVTKINGTKFFAPVVMPGGNLRVCRFSLVYQDVNNADAIVARLLRKTFAIGGDPFNNPLTLATVTSAPGVVSTTRVATTTTIASPVVRSANSFYYAEIDSPTFNLNIIGVQVDVRPTCT